MGSYRQAFWATEQGGIDLARRDRASGVYLAFIPDRIGKRSFAIAANAAADIDDATRALAKLEGHTGALTDTEALARLLLRAESVASSFIEGLEVSPGRLLQADFARAHGIANDDAVANAVLGNVDAMGYAIAHAHEPLSPALITSVHRRLLAGSSLEWLAGVVREKQNWIGGSEYNPLAAAFVPPPPELVPELLADLCDFSNRDDMPTLAQAAIAHAQFETIHPFGDGNGRAGRSLIHMILRRRGLSERIVPPISLLLSTHSKEYVRHLQAYRHDGSPDDAVALSAQDDWIGFFANAARQAANHARAFEDRIEQLQIDWLARIPSTRADSGARALVARLPSSPLLSIQSASALLDRSVAPTIDAIEALVSVGILRPTTKRQRGQVYEAREIVDAFRDLERQLASPSANTQIEKPTRPVPQRANN
jgi:Fic family protein